MPLSCSCDWDDDDGPWWWSPDDYSTLNTKRRKRCSSCTDMIEIGATVAEFTRSREPRSDIEDRIYGDGPEAIRLAPHYLCERCADLYFSLSELGFECVGPSEDMRELVREYAETYRGAA